MKTRAAKHEGLKAARFAARLLAVAIMIGSLLSALAPLAAASSTGMCTMECCIGHPPHVAGSCSTDLVEAAGQTQPEPEILCGSPLSKIKQVKIAAVVTKTANDEDAVSCAMHAAGGDSSQSSPDSKAPGLFVRTLSSPCSADCGACSASNSVNPRPREQAAVAWAAQARPPTRSLSFSSSSSPTATLRGHYKQPRPRGPPTFLS
jgi:hypothetical protein